MDLHYSMTSGIVNPKKGSNAQQKIRPRVPAIGHNLRVSSTDLRGACARSARSALRSRRGASAKYLEECWRER